MSPRVSCQQVQVSISCFSQPPLILPSLPTTTMLRTPRVLAVAAKAARVAAPRALPAGRIVASRVPAAL